MTLLRKEFKKVIQAYTDKSTMEKGMSSLRIKMKIEDKIDDKIEDKIEEKKEDNNNEI